MKKTALFLIQAKAGLPRIYRFLKDKPHLLLSYHEETADTTLYAPDTTWASGRNKLIAHVKANRLFYDYYVFLDEDAVFIGLSQKAGFEMFLSILSVIDYPIVTPAKNYVNRCSNHKELDGILPAAVCRKGVENPQWELQTVDWFDGIFNAFSREAFFDERLLPYEEKFDCQSWWMSDFITVLRANHCYRNRIVQCNRIRVRNTQHSRYPCGFENYGTACRHVFSQLGIDTIEMSTGEEVKPNARASSPLLFNLWYRGVEIIGWMRYRWRKRLMTSFWWPYGVKITGRARLLMRILFIHSGKFIHRLWNIPSNGCSTDKARKRRV